MIRLIEARYERLQMVEQGAGPGVEPEPEPEPVEPEPEPEPEQPQPPSPDSAANALAVSDLVKKYGVTGDKANAVLRAIGGDLQMAEEILSRHSSPAPSARESSVKLFTLQKALAPMGFGMDLDEHGSIFNVKPGGPADEAGIVKDCLILAVQGKPVNSRKDIKARLSNLGKTVEFTVLVPSRPAGPDQAQAQVQQQQQQQSERDQALAEELSSEGKAGSPLLRADTAIVSALQAMGFDERHCKRAALATGNAGVEQAMEWMLANPIFRITKLDSRDGFGMDIDEKGRILVVIRGGSAADQGVEKDYRIVEVDGMPVDTREDITTQLGNLGRTVNFTLRAPSGDSTAVSPHGRLTQLGGGRKSSIRKLKRRKLKRRKSLRRKSSRRKSSRRKSSRRKSSRRKSKRRKSNRKK